MFRRARLFGLLALSILLPACGEDARPQRPVTQAGPMKAEAVRPTAIPTTPPPPVAAESVIVIDPVSGRVLYAKNADQRRPVASTQKLVTALVAMDSDLDKSVTISAEDERCEPTKLEMKPGEVHTRRELLRVLMVKSANDVGRAIARDIGGSQEGFAALMNQKAAQLGMKNSHFINPHGLPQEGQYSTARDMAIAARSAWRSQTIRSFTCLQSTTFQHGDGRVKTLQNTNKLLKRVPYCDGLKTGTTDAAGRCLISSGTLGGRSAIVVVLKSTTPNIWNDSEKLLRWSLENPASQG